MEAGDGTVDANDSKPLGGARRGVGKPGSQGVSMGEGLLECEERLVVGVDGEGAEREEEEEEKERANSGHC